MSETYVKSDVETTLVVGALVCKIDVERWALVKQAVRDAGGAIIYQRVAPLEARLRVVEEVRT